MAAPDREDVFTVSFTPAAEEPIEFFPLREFQDAGSFLRQFAVWPISDNPAAGCGPDDREIEAIRCGPDRPIGATDLILLHPGPGYPAAAHSDPAVIPAAWTGPRAVPGAQDPSLVVASPSPPAPRWACEFRRNSCYSMSGNTLPHGHSCRPPRLDALHRQRGTMKLFQTALPTVLAAGLAIAGCGPPPAPAAPARLPCL